MALFSILKLNLIQIIAVKEVNTTDIVYCMIAEIFTQTKIGVLQRRKVPNLKPHIEILRKNSKCLLCLKSGHIFKNCTSSYIYRKCIGKHYSS